MLPFLERAEILQLCRIIPILFQMQHTWKTLVHASAPFYSKPEHANRKYEAFLRQRYRTRLNWSIQKSITHVWKIHPFSEPDTLDIATDSTHITILQTQFLNQKSYFNIYDMDCKFVAKSTAFKWLRHLQAKGGKALASGFGKMELLSLETAKSLHFPKYPVDDAVFLDDSSIVTAGNGKLCQIDLGKPDSCSILSCFPDSYNIIKLCNTTVRNRVLGYWRSQLTMWDIRQSTACHQFFKIKNMQPMFYDVCAGGENSFFVWSRDHISEYDIRFGGITGLPCASAVQHVQWTPDFLYADLVNEGVLRFSNMMPEEKQFLPLLFGLGNYNKFDITDRHCVNVSRGRNALTLSCVGFE